MGGKWCEKKQSPRTLGLCFFSHHFSPMSGTLFSRPGRSQVLLFNHLLHWFIKSLTDCRHALRFGDGASIYKIDYVTIFEEIINSEGHQNCITGSKVTAILLSRWILPTGRASLGRVRSCSLRSRLVFTYVKVNFATANWGPNSTFKSCFMCKLR